jgi:uncharacterized protein (TIGR02996 family)
VTDRDALFAMADESPADDAPRLVLADWLDEHGEEDLAAIVRCCCRLLRSAAEVHEVSRGAELLGVASRDFRVWHVLTERRAVSAVWRRIQLRAFGGLVLCGFNAARFDAGVFKVLVHYTHDRR